jgi:hypothetical protein
MNDLPLITRILIGALLLAAVLAVILARDSRRERALRSWVAKRRNARLHWPLEMDGDLPIPFRELADLTLGRPPLGWAAAVEIERAEDQIWFLECRTTPAGRETADWFTLAACGPKDGFSDPSAWQCHLIDELLSADLVFEELRRMDGGKPAEA